MSKYYEYIGDVIRKERKKQGLTQQQMADKLGIKRGAYSQYETGKNSISMEMWYRVALILNIDLYTVPMEALKYSSNN
ncbi:MAG: helix-turn-helix transcriptional regulator [Blautia sp.]|nr:helix-turn-helix transcriptional regulator [Blautia sp.]